MGYVHQNLNFSMREVWEKNVLYHALPTSFGVFWGTLFWHETKSQLENEQYESQKFRHLHVPFQELDDPTWFAGNEPGKDQHKHL